jgi:putative membrane protein
MAIGSDVKLGQLTRYIFTAPSWIRSLFLIALLGLLIDGVGVRAWVILPVSNLPFSGTIAFTLPAFAGFLFTKLLIEHSGKAMTWNRSALLALSCTVFGVIITLSAFISRVVPVSLFYAISLAFVFGLRLFVLVAIADYRVPRMLVPAFTQSGVGILAGMFLFPPAAGFLLFALVLHCVFGLGFAILIWLIERPLQRAFRIRGLAFINAFIAHTTDGSKGMEDFFREIGEEIYVPQESLFFRRTPGKGVIFTVPNLHPGPMGEIGGGNLPKILHDNFEEETLVPHGCATHDFNLVSESEITKVIEAVKASQRDLHYTGTATRSLRLSSGSVHLLFQRFGDAILLVATRSPQRTEDLDFAVGMAIMAEGHRWYPHVAFVDAHNCMTDLSSPVLAATLTATEYQKAAQTAMETCLGEPLQPFAIGVAHQTVPFSREQGFGDLGIQVLVIDVAGQKTAYVLIDGNNMAQGMREVLLETILSQVDNAEVMTTDSHVVNTISGKNPVGMHVPPSEFLPFVMQAVGDAITDLAPAQAAAGTAHCDRIVVFGSNRISQLASTVNAMLIYVAPLSLAMLLLAFLLSIVAYIVIV